MSQPQPQYFSIDTAIRIIRPFLLWRLLLPSKAKIDLQTFFSRFILFCFLVSVKSLQNRRPNDTQEFLRLLQ